MPRPSQPWPPPPVEVGRAERIEFIRTAAIGVVVAKNIPDDLISKKRLIDRAWADARALWDAKPEDC
jgi:hypothetical protein